MPEAGAAPADAAAEPAAAAPEGATESPSAEATGLPDLAPSGLQPEHSQQAEVAAAGPDLAPASAPALAIESGVLRRPTPVGDTAEELKVRLLPRLLIHLDCSCLRHTVSEERRLLLAAGSLVQRDKEACIPGDCLPWSL